MLILLRQLRTGENPTTGIDIFEQKHFNSATTSIITTVVEDGQLDQYEMATGQLVFDPGAGTQYVYNGAGGVTTQATPGTATYELILIRVNSGGDTVTDSLGFQPAGASVAVTTALPDGFIFDRWTRFGLQVSTAQSFSYTMPAANTILQARFMAEEAEPEPSPIPAPEPIPDSFYDLELRVRGIQIPMPPFVQKAIEGLLSDVLEGEYSYPVNIPLSPKEMAALGLPNDPQTKASFIDPIPGEIWSHGNMRYRGHLEILRSDEERIRSTFILDSGFFISQNQELKLPQCYGPEDVIDISKQTVYAVGGFELRFNYRDIRLTVNSFSRNFLTAEYPDHISMLDGMVAWLTGLGIGLSVTTEVSEDPTDESSKIIYWDTTTITTCSLAPVTGTSRFTRAKKLTSRRFLMTEFETVDDANRIAFPPIYNRNLYEGNNALHDGIVNRYDEAGRLYVSNIKYLTYSESFRWEHCIIPFLYLTDVVRQIFKHLRIEVSGDFFDDDRVKRMLLYNNRTLDFVEVKINGSKSRRTALNVFHGDGNPSNETYFYENVHNLVIQLANHAPDYSVPTFLRGLKNYFGLKFNFNILQNRVEIRFVRSIIRSREVLDLTRQAGRVFTLHHGKNSGFAFTYENPDPIMQDGAQNPPPADDAVDFTVQNYLALDGLDAELFQIAYVESLRAWFQLVPDQSNPPFWKLYAFRQQSDTNAAVGVSTDRNKRPWSLTLYPLVDSFNAGKKMPAIECTVNNREVKLENKECGLRIMAFYGVQQDALGRSAPFASCTRYNAAELLSASMYDLDIRSEDMYPLHADQEQIITAGKEYESTLIIDEYNLLQLSRSPVIRIANLDYLLEEREVQNSSKEYALAKVRLFKIK
jgi:hypothetical protein